jgi:hypothetical protein
MGSGSSTNSHARWKRRDFLEDKPYASAMSLTLKTSEIVKLHRELVTAALREVIGLETVRGRPTSTVVNEYYRRLPPAAQLIAAHDDPLGLAFKLAGEEAPALDEAASSGYREKFERLRKRFYVSRSAAA